MKLIYRIQLCSKESVLFTDHIPIFDHPIKDHLNVWFGFKYLSIDLDLIANISVTIGEGWKMLWRCS